MSEPEGMKELIKSQRYARAHGVVLVPCPGECAVHILLMDEEGFIISDAPLSRNEAEHLGNAIFMIGLGADPQKTIDKAEERLSAN